MKEVTGGFIIVIIGLLFIASFFQLPETMERYSNLSRINVEILEGLKEGKTVEAVMDSVRTQSNDIYVLINNSDPYIFPSRIFEPYEKIEVEVTEMYMWGMMWGKYRPKLNLMVSKRAR